MRHAQFAICQAWLARTYRGHKHAYTVERSVDHTRYLFHYVGDAVPFLTLHTFKTEGVLKAFYRTDGAEPRQNGVGYPFEVIDKGGTRSLLKVWNGQYWDLRIVASDTVSGFRLYLNRGAVGILWESVQCQ